jgi:hypothetical protein
MHIVVDDMDTLQRPSGNGHQCLFEQPGQAQRGQELGVKPR